MAIRTDETMVSNGQLKQIGFSFRVSNAHGSRMAVFSCECGRRIPLDVKNVRAGRTKSCGCRTGLSISERKRTHGQRHTRAYDIWSNMKSRCQNKNNPRWDDYGGRGISVCSRWESFEKFFADMGSPPPGMTIERKNNHGDYDPSNCKWATLIEQGRNKRTNHLITANGKTMSLAAWSEETGINRSAILSRLSRGWSDNDAVNTPVIR